MKLAQVETHCKLALGKIVTAVFSYANKDVRYLSSCVRISVILTANAQRREETRRTSMPQYLCCGADSALGSGGSMRAQESPLMSHDFHVLCL